MRLWLIPATYVAASSVCAMILPRLEHAYLGATKFMLSVASAHAVLSAAASGMMALTAIVFAVAFVVVQFSATAYSPRVVLWLTRDRTLFHTLGIFVATFIYALWTLAWVDRSGAGTVPMFSVLLVAVLVIVSMLLFAQMVERLNDLQINHILQAIGDSGRGVIKTMFVPLRPRDEAPSNPAQPAPTPDARTQVLTYSGPPRTIAKLDIDRLVTLAQRADGVIVMTCAVGDTLVEGEALLQVHGDRTPLSGADLHSAIHLAQERTFEQDPKYPIRLLVDIAIKALSPAVNDPTTAVQTIDQIEDLLRRLGRSDLDVGSVRDAAGTLRVIYPVPSWEDYLALSFDEIRQFGDTSVQVMRRLRSALVGITDYVTDETRRTAVRRYLDHLDVTIDRSSFDQQDRTLARQEDRQGIGLSRHKPQDEGSAKREAAV